jgi:DNA (cytosine-5)-methyltransferase 1
MHDQQIILGGGGEMNNVVRRLTPLECERLQGYPDGWTDIGEWTDTKGKKHKDADSPRYKALGNSIALPYWQWMAARMVKYIDHEPTMASLFDGIGGFPLVFSRYGCTPVWASEIEEFPIAVTKIHFPEQEDES